MTTIMQFKPRDFLVTVLFLQVLLFTTVFFDVPVARQVVAFIYFTFVPGFIILKLFKLDALDWLEKVVFSVGLSIAFLMIVGLLVNEFSLFFGVSNPLSFLPLMIVMNSIILMCVVIIYLKRENVKIWKSGTTDKSPFTLLFLCILCALYG